MKSLQDVKAFVLDMDGTLYLGERLLPGAAQFIDLLRERGTPFLLLTNNSSRHRSLYAEKLGLLGLEIPPAQIFTSGEATALYLKRQHPASQRIFLVGTPALEEEFAGHGFTLTANDPQVAVLGFDTGITYQKLWQLCDFVRAGLPYIATHPDLNCPIEGGYMPDIGAVIAFVEASTGRQPDVIVGKPHPPIVAALADRTGLPVDALCMVGDRLYTDIALGAAGLTTVLVLSGEARREDIPAAPHPPDYVMENLAALAAALQQQP